MWKVAFFSCRILFKFWFCTIISAATTHFINNLVILIWRFSCLSSLRSEGPWCPTCFLGSKKWRSVRLCRRETEKWGGTEVSNISGRERNQVGVDLHLYGLDSHGSATWLWWVYKLIIPYNMFGDDCYKDTDTAQDTCGSLHEVLSWWNYKDKNCLQIVRHVLFPRWRTTWHDDFS